MIDQELLDQEREDMIVRADKGEDVICRLCKKKFAIYNNSFSSTRVKSLRLIYEIGLNRPGGWVDVQNEFASRGLVATSMGYTCLKYWGLIECKANEDPAKNSSGLYRINSTGLDFLKGKSEIRKKAVTIDGEVIRFEGKMISVNDVVGNFNFQELFR